MDCSNPVMDSTRVTIASMYSHSSSMKRQDLAYLKLLSEGAPRLRLPAAPARSVEEGQMKAELKALRSGMPEVPKASSGPLQLPFLEQVAPAFPVCRIQIDGLPIHPVGKNQSQGSVSTQRTFGGGKVDWTLVQTLLRYMEPEQIEAALKKCVYTAGTPEGFVKRLQEQTTRKCVSVYKTCGGPAQVRERLRELLPVTGTLWDWSEDLDPLTDRVVSSKTATAGPPYWRPKQEVLRDVQRVMVPMLHKALSDGTVSQLYREQPELFLAECKNKTDRYEWEKLDDKCRPYFSFPFHWSLLFSVLSQSFTGGLGTFRTGGANAYGFSWAHGGADALFEWAKGVKDLKLKGGRPRFCAYGDDVDFYFRREGRLYRIAPDFRQMDGSVDRDLVEEVIRYILDEHQRQHGPAPREFWEAVGRVWADMATNPHFIVSGTTVYRKKQRDGLATGVVGTTLFDTAKSVLAYDAFVTQLHDYRRYELLEETHAVAFFRTHGLEIKEGTWNPLPVEENRIPGELMSEHKFLGMQLIHGTDGDEPVMLPYLPPEDWWQNLLVPREAISPGQPRPSKTSELRTLFDRIRGLLTTGAVFSKHAAGVLYALIDHIPGEVILMSVQAGGGGGEVPPSAVHLDDDFRYPSSEGVPTLQWAINLYRQDKDWCLENNPFPSVFPTLEESISDYRRIWRRLPTVRKVVTGPEASVLVSVPPSSDEGVRATPLTGKPGPTYADAVVGRKPLNVTVKDGVLSVKEATKPTRPQCLVRILSSPPTQEELDTVSSQLFQLRIAALLSKDARFEEDVLTAKGPLMKWLEAEGRLYTVLPEAEVCLRLHCSPAEARKAAEQAGVLVVGPWNSKWYSPVPLLLPPAQSEQQEAQLKEIRERPKSKGLSTTVGDLEAIKRVDHPPAYLPGGIIPLAPNPPLPQRVVKGTDLWSIWVGSFQTAGVKIRHASRNVRIPGGQETQMVITYQVEGGDDVPWLDVFGESSKHCRAVACEFFSYVTETKVYLEEEFDATDWTKDLDKAASLEVYRGRVKVCELRGRTLHAGPALETTGWRIDNGRLVGVMDGSERAVRKRMTESVEAFVKRLQHALPPGLTYKTNYDPKNPQSPPNKTYDAECPQSSPSQESGGEGGCPSPPPKKEEAQKATPQSSSGAETHNGDGSRPLQSNTERDQGRNRAARFPPQPEHSGRVPPRHRGGNMGPMAPRETGGGGGGRRLDVDRRDGRGRLERGPPVRQRRPLHQSHDMSPQQHHDPPLGHREISDTLRYLTQVVSQWGPRRGDQPRVHRGGRRY